MSHKFSLGRGAGWMARGAAIVLVSAMAGCTGAPDGPPTHPVRGRVEFLRGGKIEDLNNAQATIVFQSVDEPAIWAYGEILEDGTFTLGSTKDGLPLERPGVVAGKYRGKLQLDFDDRDLVAAQFLSSDKSNITFTAPSDAEVVVKVWR